MPVAFGSDREAVEAAVELASRNRKELQIAHIDNTLELEEFYVSPALAGHTGLEIVGPVQAMNFDAVGTLVKYI